MTLFSSTSMQKPQFVLCTYAYRNLLCLDNLLNSINFLLVTVCHRLLIIFRKAFGEIKLYQEASGTYCEIFNCSILTTKITAINQKLLISKKIC